MDALNQMDKFVKEIVEAYKKDPTAASLVISFLPNGNYYASVVRYLERFGKGKEVVCSAQNPSLSECLTELYTHFTGGTAERQIKVGGELSEREIELFMEIYHVESQIGSPTLTTINEKYGELFSLEEIKLIEDFHK